MDNRRPPKVYSKLNGALRYLGLVGQLAIKRKVSEMRSAKYFHSEGDYATAKGFLVAMAIGVIASGQVVLSLVDVRIDEASVAAQILAAPAQALIGAPEATQPPAQPVVESTMDSGADNRLGAAVNESSTDPKVVEPDVIANPLAEVSPNDGSIKVAALPSVAAAPAENKTSKNRRIVRPAKPRVARGGYGAWGWGGSAAHL